MKPTDEAEDFILLDRHFNRAWLGSRHFYHDNVSTRQDWTSTYDGLVKCKLAHGESYSIMIPELLFLKTEPLTWIQPLHFMPNLLQKHDEIVYGGLFVDISCGVTVGVRLDNKSKIHRYADGSELYACTIDGPDRLNEYVTGIAKDSRQGLPIIQLFHHTSADSKKKIIESGFFLGSKWNIQGNKHLAEVEYVYFTCLPRLDCNECLKTVAMSSNGKIHLRRDPVPPIELVPDRREDDGNQDVLELKVYRESTKNRTSTVDVWVDPAVLSPNHLIRHFDGSTQVWYEVISAFIYRVGVLPGKKTGFDPFVGHADASEFVHPGYSVIGDGWTMAGLGAPFDEENTDHVLKIELVPDSSCILDFWFDHANSHRYEELDPRRFKFGESD